MTVRSFVKGVFRAFPWFLLGGLRAIPIIALWWAVFSLGFIALGVGGILLEEALGVPDSQIFSMDPHR